MFDIGFLELAIIFIITLVVVGPDRLPDAVKSGVRFITKLKRFMAQTKKDIETQIGADEIRRELHNEEVLKSIESFKSVQKELQEQKQALAERLAEDPTQGTDENEFADPGLAHPVDTLVSHPVDTLVSHPVDTLVSHPVDDLSDHSKQATCDDQLDASCDAEVKPVSDHAEGSTVTCKDHVDSSLDHQTAKTTYDK